MNGQLNGKDYSQMTLKDMMGICSITLPNGRRFNPALPIQGTCPGCGTKQRGWVGDDHTTALYCCTQERSLILGESDQPLKVVTYA